MDELGTMGMPLVWSFVLHRGAGELGCVGLVALWDALLEEVGGGWVVTISAFTLALSLLLLLVLLSLLLMLCAGLYASTEHVPWVQF